jgi:hypothetical protein
MKFKLYKIESENLKVDDLVPTNNWNIFRKSSNKDDVSIFNVAKLSNDTHHIIFYLSDEYFSGTKNGGENYSHPIEEYINSFIIGNHIFIENITKNYLKMIADFMDKKFSIELSTVNLENKHFIKIVDQTKGFVKKVELSGEDNFDNEFSFNNFTTNKQELSLTDAKIEVITLLIQSNFVSVYDDGLLSVGTNDENDLIKTLEVISSAVN